MIQRCLPTTRCVARVGILSVLLSLTHLSSAAEVVLSDDGREVQLNDDGTWQYLSNDRFATNKNGERIRLGEDGRWVVEENSQQWLSIPAMALKTSQDSASADTTQMRLAAVTIESARETQQKNKRLRSQMIFSLDLTPTLQDLAYQPIKADFRITDSRGREYPIKLVTPVQFTVAAGTQGTLTIVADGSPRWWGIKFFKLEVLADTLVGDQSIELKKSTSEVTRKEVKALSFD